ncbi:MAG: hypothetical protein K9K62_02495 [Desulfobacteraceae bacterium]|nr:hypothetical protein [Desulfobacteraceae bacterium]
MINDHYIEQGSWCQGDFKSQVFLCKVLQWNAIDFQNRLPDQNVLFIVEIKISIAIEKMPITTTTFRLISVALQMRGVLQKNHQASRTFAGRAAGEVCASAVR